MHLEIGGVHALVAEHVDTLVRVSFSNSNPSRHLYATTVPCERFDVLNVMSAQVGRGLHSTAV